MTQMTEAEVRAVNLIEILQEECEEKGLDVPAPPASACTWSEEDIRTYFATCGAQVPPAPDEAFNTWFPGLKRSGTAVGSPTMRVVCFPNAGNAEDMYTSEGTGVRKVSSPLLAWCREYQVECLAPQYPGRGMRMKEPRIETAKEMAAALFPVLAPSLTNPSIPWVLVCHSVGTWIAYEFLCLCNKHGVPMPQKAFISAMPSPDIPFEERPWRQQRNLDEEQFKQECRAWDISEIVFSPAMWPMYEPLLRSDFTMFDEYEFDRENACTFDFPIFAFWGRDDARVKEHHVRGWSAFTTGAFSMTEIRGNHLWPLDKESKVAWLENIVCNMMK